MQNSAETPKLFLKCHHPSYALSTFSSSFLLAHPAQPSECQGLGTWVGRDVVVPLAIALRMNGAPKTFVWSETRVGSQPVLVAVADRGLFPIAVARPILACADVDTCTVALGDVFTMLVMRLLVRRSCKDWAGNEESRQGHENVGEHFETCR
jgi:hypothetical protein